MIAVTLSYLVDLMAIYLLAGLGLGFPVLVLGLLFFDPGLPLFSDCC